MFDGPISDDFHIKAWQIARYGLSPHMVRSLLGMKRCMICGGAQRTGEPDSRLQIDHEHKSGKVRGLLCGNCNSGLSRFEDSEDLLWRAIEYLRTERFYRTPS